MNGRSADLPRGAVEGGARQPVERGAPAHRVDEARRLGAPTAAQVPIAALLGGESVRPTLGSAPDLGPSPDPFRPSAPVPARATATPLAPAYVAAPAIAQISSPPVGSDLPPSGPDPSSSQSSAAEKALGKLPTPRIEPKTGDSSRHEVISHFPLEHDPDESVQYAVPGPPRVPSGTRSRTRTRSAPPPK